MYRAGKGSNFFLNETNDYALYTEILFILRYNQDILFIKDSFVWYKARSMALPVRIEVMNNGLMSSSVTITQYESTNYRVS